MPINPGLGFVLGETAASQLDLPPNRAVFYGALGAILPTPVGLGVTLALAKQEAAAQPPPQPPPQPQPQPPPLQVPGQVPALTVTGTAPDSVSLSWTAPSDGGTVATYAVQFSPHTASVFATALTTDPAATIANVAGLISGQSYDFRVIAANAAGFGPPSPIATATPQLAPPGPVTGLASSAQNIDSVTVVWNAPTTGGPVTNYTVQHRTPAGAGNFTSSPTPDATTTFQVTGLTASTQYEFQVAGVNSAGTGQASASITASTTGPAIPAARRPP